MTPSLSVVAEALVIGYFAMVWVGLLAYRLGMLGGEVPSGLLDPRWLPAFIPASAIVAYVLGWLVYTVSNQVFIPVFLRKKFKRTVIDDTGRDRESIRAAVFQLAPPAVARELENERSVIRLAEAGILNFTMTAVACLFVGGVGYRWAIAALVAAVVSGWQMYRFYERYHRRLVAAFKQLPTASPGSVESPRAST